MIEGDITFSTNFFSILLFADFFLRLFLLHQLPPIPLKLAVSFHWIS